MKYSYLLLLFIAISCNSPKKKSTENSNSSQSDVENTVTEKKKTEKKVDNDLLDPTQDLIVVLNNPEHITETKELVTNSGLKWDKTLLDKDALKIGLIKIPANKRDYWLDKLMESGDFKYVKLYSEKTLKELIAKEKKNFLSLRKTDCMGDCPVYNLTIDKNGNVIFKGIKYVLETGERKFKLADKEFNTLKEKLNKKDFSTFKEKYDNPEVLDLPSTYISHKGKQVQVRIWKDAPDELIEIHEFLEQILLRKKFFK